jgi:hypothetical protein
VKPVQLGPADDVAPLELLDPEAKVDICRSVWMEPHCGQRISCPVELIRCSFENAC